MNSADNRPIENVIDSSGQSLITEIYQRIEHLSLPEKAALAQHLLNTNELSVVVSSSATVGNAIQHMDHTALGNTLESIAKQVRRLDKSSLD